MCRTRAAHEGTGRDIPPTEGGGAGLGEPDGPRTILMAEGTQQRLDEKNPGPAKPLNLADDGLAR